MKVKKLFNKQNKEIIGAFEIIPNIFKDPRGHFLETWNESKFNKFIGLNIKFVQDNQSLSTKGTLRGLHYQIDPMAQGKLVRVNKGEILDVIVDLREDSDTFLSWVGVELNSIKKNQIWIPRGFAHGFLTLSDEALVDYKVTNFWDKDCERTILWNDPNLQINWLRSKYNLSRFLLSEKDKNGYSLESILSRKEIFI